MKGVIPANKIKEYYLSLKEIESKNQKNLKNLFEVKQICIQQEKQWIKSTSYTHLKTEILNLYKEECFILDYFHHLFLLNRYFDHPDYIKSLSIYSELFKKYKIKPIPLNNKTKLVSNKLIEQLKWKEIEIELDVSPSNLMFSNFILGKGYFQIHDFKNAIKYFKMAISNQIKNSGISIHECYLELGKSFYYINNFKRAIISFNEAISILEKFNEFESDLSNIYYYRGLSYKALRNWTNSINDFIDCKRIDRKNLSLEHNYIQIVLKEIVFISNYLNKKKYIIYLDEYITYLKRFSSLNNLIELARSYKLKNEINKSLFFYEKFLLKKSEEDILFSFFVEDLDEDFINFNDTELIEALNFIEENDFSHSIRNNWIYKLIELKNEID